MSDMLIRNIPDATKRRLAERAAENGRSQSAEALAILQAELDPPKKEWWQLLREAALEVGGVELELERPTWAEPRPVVFE